ncbi:hypothetical protein GEMRC1_012847 [Eukaryota sp. GEM-RC1]
MECKLCCESFTKDNLPVIICTDGHTVCQRCCSKLRACPYRCKTFLPNPIINRELFSLLSSENLIKKGLEVDRLFRFAGLSDSDDLIPLMNFILKNMTIVFPQLQLIFHLIFVQPLLTLRPYISMDNLLIAGGAVQKVICGQDLEDVYSISDIDFFIYGINSTDQATARVNQFINELKEHCSYVVRGSHCITVDAGCQIILRLYSSKSEILHGFDLGSSQVGFDGKQLYTTTLGKLSYTYMINIVDPSRRSTSYEYRLGKYLKRGFKIVLPNLDVKKMRNKIQEDSFFSGLPYLLLEFEESHGEGNNIVVENVESDSKVSVKSDYGLTNTVKPKDAEGNIFDSPKRNCLDELLPVLFQNVQSIVTGKLQFFSLSFPLEKGFTDVRHIPFFWGLDTTNSFADISNFYKSRTLVSTKGDLKITSLKKFFNVVPISEVIDLFYSPNISFARKLQYLENLKEKTNQGSC